MVEENMRNNEYERLFNSDVREKRVAGYGACKRKATRASKKALKFPSDYLSKSEIKLLSGEVKVSSLYDKYQDVNNLPKKQELKFLSKTNPNECKNILAMAKQYNSGTQICKATGLSSGSLYNLYDKVGVVYEKKGVRGGKVTKPKPKPKVEQTVLIEQPKSIKENFDDKLDKLYNLISELKTVDNNNTPAGFTFNMSGTYTKKEIEDRILSLGAIMLDDNKYKFTLSLTEVSNE